MTMKDGYDKEKGKVNSLERVLLILWLSILFVATVFIVVGEARAQSGCQASSLAETATVDVLQSTELVGAIGENQTPNPQAVNDYYQTQVMIDYQGQRVLLLAPCVDDAVRVVNLTTGREWFWTYASADGSRIMTKTEMEDITNLFVPYSPGQHLIEVSLIDVRPEYHSASPIVLYQVAGQPPIEASASGTPSSDGILVFESIGQSTTTPTMVITPFLAQVATPPTNDPTSNTEVAILVEPETAEEAGKTEARAIDSDWPVPWWLVGAVLLSSVGLWVYGSQLRIVTPPGGWDIHLKGQYQRTIEFSNIKKSQIRAGSDPGIEVVLEGDGIPPVAVRVVNQTGEQGQRQAVYETLDPEDPEYVVERYVLEHGDEHFIGDYKLVYFTYQAEESFYERSDDDD